MDLMLQGKRALITGSSAGIGAECARWLAREGCLVVVHGRDRGRAEETANGINDAGGNAAISLGDLETDEGADKVAAVLDTFKNEDLVIGPTTYSADLHIQTTRPMTIVRAKDGKFSAVGKFAAETVHLD